MTRRNIRSTPSSIPPKPKLLDQVRHVLRRKHYSIRTEQTYVGWIRRFIIFHDKRHPSEMGAPEIEAFLTHLAVVGKVAAATQNQALNALLFLYRAVLQHDIEWLNNFEHAKKPSRLPVVLTPEETRAVLNRLDETKWIMASLLYGAGLRLMECIRLRVKDIEFTRRQRVVREGKGAKDRITMLPDKVVEPLQRHLEQVKAIHQQDLREGFGAVYLPYALERKYPQANREWGWAICVPGPPTVS